MGEPVLLGQHRAMHFLCPCAAPAAWPVVGMQAELCPASARRWLKASCTAACSRAPWVNLLPHCLCRSSQTPRPLSWAKPSHATWQVVHPPDACWLFHACPGFSSPDTQCVPLALRCCRGVVRQPLCPEHEPASHAAVGSARPAGRAPAGQHFQSAPGGEAAQDSCRWGASQQR